LTTIQLLFMWKHKFFFLREDLWINTDAAGAILVKLELPERRQLSSSSWSCRQRRDGGLELELFSSNSPVLPVEEEAREQNCLSIAG
jgi:hypothetical protein